MRIKVIMDSGKDYIIHSEFNVQDFVNSFYDKELSSNGSGEVHNVKNSFVYLDSDHKILFNPTHVSSIEVMDE
ncbi:hypothetical protein [Peribacillus sp. SCS-155]|uniref:hypothetical protein n=1 Tax=Peribacillus sedimenti TaxID=3115297 RepID=UPI003905D17B